MVAVLGWEPLEYCRVIPRVSMASKFLRMNNLDGPVEFVRSFRLLDPIAVYLSVFISPTHQLGCEGSGNSTTHAATLLHVKI